MKLKLLFAWVLAFAGSGAMAQNNTSTGTNAGNGSGSAGGLENSSFGYNAGDVVIGDYNSFFGSGAGRLVTSSSYNAFFGARSGYSSTTGYSNTFIGESAGYAVTTGSANTVVGRNAFSAGTTGVSNVSIGYYSGLNTNANCNTYVGTHSGQYNVSGTLNTYIGYRAGHTSTGSNNVFLGSSAGYYETGSDKLYIDVTDTSSPLIWGDFSNNYVNVNGSLAVGTSSPSDNLHIVGTARFASLTQDNALTRVMVTNSNGKVYWRDASTLAVGDNLGNHIATQSITASTNNSYDIGSSTANFKDIYFGGRLYVGSLSYWRTTSTGSSLASLFIGESAGVSNSTGYANTSLGYYSLNANTSGQFNTALGSEALKSNTLGATNVAVGNKALESNTDGLANVAIGTFALQDNTTADANIGVGISALANTTTGNGNVAVGSAAMQSNTTGELNTVIGDYAAATAGNFTNSTAIGHNATYTASNQVRIGDANITSIGGQVSWTTLSDGRFKKSVKQDVAGLDFILKLNPVSYVVDRNSVDNFLKVPQDKRAKQSRTPERQTGFIAQEVESVVKKSNYAFYGIDAPQSDQDHYGIRYSEFVVPLVKAVQELNDKVTAQQAVIDRQEALLAALLDRESVRTTEPAATGVILYQNHPNPFGNGETEITMDIPDGIKNAVVNIYDMNGKTIDSVTVGARGKGVSIKAGGGKITSGIYLYSLLVDGRIAGVNKMIAQ